MENHDETRSKVQGFILFEKHAGNDTVNGMEETVQEGAVLKEKIPEVFINGKDTVAVCNVDELKSHRSRAPHGI